MRSFFVFLVISMSAGLSLAANGSHVYLTKKPDLASKMEKQELDEIAKYHSLYMFNDAVAPKLWNTNIFNGEITYGPFGTVQQGKDRLRCRQYSNTLSWYGQFEKHEGVVCRFPDNTYRDVRKSSIVYDSLGRKPCPFYGRSHGGYCRKN